MSLLDHAKSHVRLSTRTNRRFYNGKPQRIFTDEEIELALGWARGEVGIVHVTKTLRKYDNFVAYVFIARALRQWINNQR